MAIYANLSGRSPIVLITPVFISYMATNPPHPLQIEGTGCVVDMFATSFLSAKRAGNCVTPIPIITPDVIRANGGICGHKIKKRPMAHSYKSSLKSLDLRMGNTLGNGFRYTLGVWGSEEKGGKEREWEGYVVV